MITCSNCNQSFDSDRDGLVLTNKGKHVAAVCGACCTDVRVGKLVVRRPSTKGWVGVFVYEQWSPTEMIGDTPD